MLFKIQNKQKQKRKATSCKLRKNCFWKYHHNLQFICIIVSTVKKAVAEGGSTKSCILILSR